MASIGQRGKWAEKQVNTWMKARNDAAARFAFLRYPDARAGSLQTAPSDFLATSNGVHYKVEVKEVTIPPTRKTRLLPQANFSSDKVSRMAKWRLAGDTCMVIVCHLPMREWRLVPLSVFLGPKVPSWDLTEHQAYKTHGELLLALFGEI